MLMSRKFTFFIEDLTGKPYICPRKLIFMENFSDLIRNRRSMRKFTSEELTQYQVLTLLKAALMSPSSKRSNCWQFIVIDDKDTLENCLSARNRELPL